ncbi:MAG: transposase [Planctomycetota bacterium]
MIRHWLSTRPKADEVITTEYRPNLRPLRWWMLPDVEKRRRRLPRWDLKGSTYFVTYRVNTGLGNVFLRHPKAAIAVEEMLFYDYRFLYDLDAYVVMPDHFHALIRPLSGEPLGKILGLIKGRSSRAANLEIGRTGRLWFPKYFDRIIRSRDDWRERFMYIHQDPLRSRLVEDEVSWPWSSAVTMHSEGRLASYPIAWAPESEEFRRGQ